MPDRIIFYPLDVTYKIRNNHAVIYLYGKTAEQRVCVTYAQFQPYFYVEPQTITPQLITELKINPEIVDVQAVTKKNLGRNITLLKVFTQLPQQVPFVKSKLQRHPQIKNCYEYDILFTRRFLMDMRITPLSPIQVTGNFVNDHSKVQVFQAEQFDSAEQTKTDYRILSIDIETYNPKGKGMDVEQPILMIALYGDDYKKVLTWKNIPDCEVFQNEQQMLQRFKEVIEQQKPEILTGYYSDGFDLPYIIARAKKYNLNLDVGLDYSILTDEKRDDIKITGIVHLDVFQFVKHVIGRSLKSGNYKLDSVASELLGERKHPIDIENLAAEWDSNSSRLSQFAAYNLQDTKITFQLCKKLLPNMEELSKIIGLPLFDICRMSFSRLVESYIMNQTAQYNELIPNKIDEQTMRTRRMKTYAGGFVYQPTPGLYENVAVFDFRSLYPTIIISHNISPSSYKCSCCYDVIAETKDWFCKKEKGFLPTVLEDIVTRRAKLKQLLKKDNNIMLEAQSNALKLLANSFYGYLGFAPARWYSFESAANVTALGRKYIQSVITEAEQSGFSVTYSDTDSIFLRLGNTSKEEAHTFVERINAKLQGIMELDYEGFYPAALFVSAKASTIGAKKKYAMLNEHGQLKIRGFETVRRNWSIIAKQIQLRVLEMLLKEKDKEKAVLYVKEMVRAVRAHKIPAEQMIIGTQLTRAIESYGSIGPHVAVAQRMVQKGMSVPPGTIINFIVAEGSGVVRERACSLEEMGKKLYDANYYIDHQIIPSVDRILAVVGVDIKNEVLPQKSLQNFFT